MGVVKTMARTAYCPEVTGRKTWCSLSQSAHIKGRMSDSPDAELLKQFVRNKSEAAFAELVERDIGLVYSTVFPKTGNSQQSEDITQVVFIILARKANSLGPKTVFCL